jgi:hypothetical protein
MTTAFLPHHPDLSVRSAPDQSADIVPIAEYQSARRANSQDRMPAGGAGTRTPFPHSRQPWRRHRSQALGSSEKNLAAWAACVPVLWCWDAVPFQAGVAAVLCSRAAALCKGVRRSSHRCKARFLCFPFETAREVHDAALNANASSTGCSARD